MTIEAARLAVVATADVSKAEAGLKSMGAQVDKAGADITKMGKSSGSAVDTLGTKVQGFGRMAGAVFGGAAAVAVLGFAKNAIRAASDLAESQSKAKEIFGASARSIEAWSNTAAKAFGQSKQDAIDAASTFATFGKSAGLAGEDLVGFSTKMTGLSSDLASFYNSSPAEAVEAIGAALRGEAEPIRRFGVLMDDASLRTAAFEAGIISSTKNALTPQQKVLAASALIMKQTSDAQGDFARTSDGLANSQRILSAQWKDAQARLGKDLLPVMKQLVQTLTDLMPLFEGLGKAVAGALKLVSPVLKAVGATFSWLNNLGADVAQGFRNWDGEVKGAFDMVSIASHRANRSVEDFTAGAWKMRDAGIMGADALNVQAEAQRKGAAATAQATGELMKQGQAAHQAELKLIALDGQWKTLMGTISDRQTARELADAAKNLEKLSKVKTPKGREELAVGVDAFKMDAASKLSGFFSTKTYSAIIEPMIDRGAYAEAARLLAALSAYRKVPFEPYPVKVPKMGQLEAFDGGGVVGGAIGQPQLAIVHGGETVVDTRPGKGNRVGSGSWPAGGGGTTNIFQIYPPTGADGARIGRELKEYIAMAEQSGAA